MNGSNNSAGRTDERPRPVPFRPLPRFEGTGTVYHDHGSRRRAIDTEIDDRRAIAEQMEGIATRREAWISSAARRADSDRAIRQLRVLLGGDEPARPIVNSQHRTPIHAIAVRIGLTSAQTLMVVNGIFGEYAKCSSSTVATIVTTRIYEWADTQEGEAAKEGIRNGGAVHLIPNHLKPEA